MPLYEVSIPVTGFYVYEVDAFDESEAKELVLMGDQDHCELMEQDCDFDSDSNNWQVEEIDN